ncbi:hypothetical protein [Pontiella sp.]|uniref:hypothetical protein n=1 Tax=Pontiella sp. TaxID=2837462 RepID=UPI00356AE764
MDTSYGDMGASEAIAVLGVFFAVMVILLIPTIFYLISLQKALTRCRPENRTLEPGMVWLLLIPLFNIVWQFLVVNHIANSLKNEFNARGEPTEEPLPGRGVGLAMCILNVVSIVPYLGSLAGLACLVCWIIYWVKIAGYSGRIANPPEENAAFPA